MADITEAIRRLIFEYVSEGADEVIKQQEAVAATTTKTDKASLSLEKSFTNLENRYDSTLKYQREYQKTQDRVNAAVAQNPALQERANSLLEKAAEHYDKLTFNAQKGGFASTLFGKALNQILGPAGLLGAAFTAVGIAVGYMAEKFINSAPTIENILEEQNRLLKEAKTLIDAKASAEQKAGAQSPELTRYQMLQNERQMLVKINEEMQKAVDLAQRRVTTPTAVSGEMGEAPTGFGPSGPGQEKIVAAFQAMQVAVSQGLPGVQQYHTELAKIAELHPELAATVNELIKAGAEGIKLEQGSEKARAFQAALKGIATDAQLAAIGFASIAQFNLANLGAEQAAAATERMAQHTLAIAASYPGMSIEVAKQLNALNGQLMVAQARTGAEQIVTQEYVTQVQLQGQGKTLSEATAIAAAQREIAEANVTKQIDDQIHALQQQVELGNAILAGTEEMTKAQQAYTNARRQGASEMQAEQLGQATLNAGNQRSFEQRVRAYEAEQAALNNAGDTIQHNTQRTIEWTTAMNTLAGAARTMTQTLAEAVDLRLDSLIPQFKPGEQFGIEINNPAALAASYISRNLAMSGNNRDAASVMKLWGPSFRDRDEPVDNLNSNLEDLTKSTDSLNATMQNALSPFYSQDPRTTKLGFRAGVTGNPDWMTGATNANPLVAVLGAGATAPGMADGGSFVVGGGYSANDNRMAVFPVASGEEVVVNRTKQPGAQVVNIDNRIIIQGAVDQDSLSQMKVSRYQQAQRMRAGLRG